MTMIDLTFDPAFHEALRRALKRYGREPESDEDRVARRLLGVQPQAQEREQAEKETPTDGDHQQRADVLPGGASGTAGPAPRGE